MEELIVTHLIINALKELKEDKNFLDKGGIAPTETGIILVRRVLADLEEHHLEFPQIQADGIGGVDLLYRNNNREVIINILGYGKVYFTCFEKNELEEVKTEGFILDDILEGTNSLLAWTFSDGAGSC